MNQCSPFPFAQWAELARRDPPGFEQARWRAVESLLEEAAGPRQVRLRALQWRLDHLRHRAGHPQRACDALAGYLWERTTGRSGLLARFAPPPAAADLASTLYFLPGRRPGAPSA